MRKISAFIICAATVLSLFAFGSSAAKSNVYYCPKAKTVPTIDGNITESEWNDALTIELDSLNAKAANGWAMNPFGASDAKATVKLLWSDDKTHGGLYISWHVTDETQSFALDKDAPAPNAMDSVQLVIDPMYQRRAKARDSAMIYTFAPYVSRVGNGFSVYPEDGATWYEHIYWVGRNESLGVRVASKLDATEDEETNRRWIIKGYDIEAYLPWKALTVLTGRPEAKIGTKMGIGFLLVDYDFDYAAYTEDYDNKRLKDVSEYQEIVNVTTDFSNGTRTTNENICAYPRNYNTIILADFSGATTSETDDNSTEKPDDVVATPNETLEEILKKDDQLNNTDYTPETWEIYSKAFQEAKDYINGKSSKTGEEVKDALIAAIRGLKLRYDLDSSSQQTDTTDEMAKLTELINSTKNLKDKYSEDQLADVNKYVEEATALLSSSNPSKSQIQNAYNALSDAIKALPESEVPQTSAEYGTREYIVVVIVAGVGTILALILVFIVMSLVKRSSKKTKSDGENKVNK